MIFSSSRSLNEEIEVVFNFCTTEKFSKPFVRQNYLINLSFPQLFLVRLI